MFPTGYLYSIRGVSKGEYFSAFTEHRFDSRLLELTAAYATGLSSLSPQQAEYAHHPENLLTLVTILALGGKGNALLALARIRPDHPAWSECLAKIREDTTAIRTGAFDEWRNDNFQRGIVKLGPVLLVTSEI